MGNPKYGFVLATGFAALLFLGLLLNSTFNPTVNIFKHVDETQYKSAALQ
jgi:hypothetical protein